LDTSSSLEITVPFYSEDMDVKAHREDKQKITELDVGIFVLLTFCLSPKLNAALAIMK